MNLSIIVATAENNIIGNDNKLLWHLPADLKYFKEITTGHPVIMGRKTYDSIGRPLPNRTNIVVSGRSGLTIEGCKVVDSIGAAIDVAAQYEQSESFIIGGAQIYKLSLPFVNKIYLTQVHARFDGDTFFPEIDYHLWKETGRQSFKADEKNKFDYDFVSYRLSVCN